PNLGERGDCSSPRMTCFPLPFPPTGGKGPGIGGETKPMIPTASPAASPAVSAPVALSLAHLAAVQKPDGAFEGEVVWNSMLLAQYVFVRTIVAGQGASPFSPEERRKMIRHFERTRTPEGGWGMHPA